MRSDHDNEKKDPTKTFFNSFLFFQFKLFYERRVVTNYKVPCISIPKLLSINALITLWDITYFNKSVYVARKLSINRPLKPFSISFTSQVHSGSCSHTSSTTLFFQEKKRCRATSKLKASSFPNVSFTFWLLLLLHQLKTI